MNINSIKPEQCIYNQQRKNKAKIRTASVVGSALGIAGSVLGVYSMAKKGNPNVSLLNLKYSGKDTLLISAGSILGGLVGGLIADKDKENVNLKLREASQQFVGNTIFPVCSSMLANKLLDKSNFKLPQINSMSKPARIANAVLKFAPKAIVTVASLLGGMKLGNKVVNSVNDKIFKEKVKHEVKPEDMLVHADDICLASSILFKDSNLVSSVVSKALPLTFLVSGAKTGMQQKNC